MANNSIGMKLPSIDKLFSMQEERDINDRTKGRIVAVPLGQIDPFPDHPFSVRMDEDMEQLVESIKERGQITPAIRPGSPAQTTVRRWLISTSANWISCAKPCGI